MTIFSEPKRKDTMDIKIQIDVSKIQEQITRNLQKELESAAGGHVSEFFAARRMNTWPDGYDSPKVIQVVKGSGLKEIEEMVANRYLDPKFQKEMADFFEENWKAIFKECMTKAIQHKANAIAFAKVKEQP